MNFTDKSEEIFFNSVPTNASVDLRNIIKDLKDQNQKYYFINKIIKKYGLPAWNKLLSSEATEAIRASDFQASTVSATINNRSKIYFIPLTDNNKVTAYIFCQERNNNYIFRLYSKALLESIMTLPNIKEDEKEDIFSKLLVISYFDQKIFNRDISKVAQQDIKKISIIINESIQSNKASGEFYLSNTGGYWNPQIVTVCYEKPKPTMRKSNEGDLFLSIVAYKEPEQICYDKVEYVWVSGTGSAPSSTGGNIGGFGTGGVGNVPTSNCPPSEWWCESGEFRYIDGILYSPDNYPGKENGYEWLWWEKEAVNLEPEDIDSEATSWWDLSKSVQGLSIQPQPKPKWNLLYSNYPQVNGEDKSVNEVVSQIGGEVYLNRGAIKNACALRVSLALNKSGIIIPQITDQTWKGSDGKNYFRGVSYLFNWLNKTFGPADLHLTESDGSPGGLNFLKKISLNDKGIYIMLPKANVGFNAQGHATLWTGYNCISGSNYFTAAKDVYIWRMPL